MGTQQQQQSNTIRKPLQQQLSAEGERVVADISQRYNVSEPAVMTLLAALVKGGKTMAQFDHPELGGAGQWSQGGMVMIGDMFNNSLKATVDAMCSELSQLLASQPFQKAAPHPQQQQQQYGGGSQMQMQGGQHQMGNASMPSSEVSLFVPSANAGNWWPEELGSPSTTGAQNDIEYAYFPEARRLAINIAGRITLYDTAEHRVSGVSQQQSGDASLTFTSQQGTVPVSRLRVVSMPTESAHHAQPQQRQAEETSQPTMAEDTTAKPVSDDVLASIEKLAQLHKKGILSDDEFAAKKAELLARL